MLLGAPILSLISKVLWWFQARSSDTDRSEDQKYKPSLASPAGRGRAPDAAGLLVERSITSLLVERSLLLERSISPAGGREVPSAVGILGEGSTRTRIPKTRLRAGCSPEEVRPRGGLWKTRPSECEGVGILERVHLWHFEFRGRKRSSSV